MNGRLARALAWIVCVAGAWADGGMPVATRSVPSGRCTLLLRPAQPCIGDAEFLMLGPGACGDACVLVERQGDAWVPIPMRWSEAESAWVGRTRFERSGPCEFRWDCAEAGPQTVTVQVSEPPSTWQSSVPWLLWWIPAGLLLVVRARAVAARTYTAKRSA